MVVRMRNLTSGRYIVSRTLGGPPGRAGQILATKALPSNRKVASSVHPRIRFYIWHPLKERPDGYFLSYMFDLFSVPTRSLTGISDRPTPERFWGIVGIRGARPDS